MSKKNKNIIENNVDTVEKTETLVETENEKVVEEKAEVKSDFPEVNTKGRFKHFQYKDGYVVYNADSKRVSDVLPFAKAEDMVIECNRLLGL